MPETMQNPRELVSKIIIDRVMARMKYYDAKMFSFPVRLEKALKDCEIKSADRDMVRAAVRTEGTLRRSVSARAKKGAEERDKFFAAKHERDLNMGDQAADITGSEKAA